MNILVLTSAYPSPTTKNGDVTEVVRCFAQDWVKQGHTVCVIHNAHRYPSFIHRLPSKLKRGLASKMGFYIPDFSEVKEAHFDDGAVSVWRLPIVKYVPHREPSQKEIASQIKKIQDILTQTQFVPDIIMGHWYSPQLQIISGLKAIYPCKTSLVLHGKGYFDDPSSHCQDFLPDIDRLGCRSRAEAAYVQSVLQLEQPPFVCYSGVPDAFVDGQAYDENKFSSLPDVWRLIYVGRLVKYKQVDKVLRALAQVDRPFVFDIIGTGGEEEKLKELARELGIADKVIFHGRLSRQEVLGFMKKAHAFVMISKGEVFGLVYMEAMAASCVVIGSENEGIDGVIRHGENGLLSAAADEEALIQTLNDLFETPREQLVSLSRAGFETAKTFSDSNVARWYLQDALGEGTEQHEHSDGAVLV